MKKSDAKIVAQELMNILEKHDVKERWMTPAELCEALRLSPNWLKRNGQFLPRLQMGPRKFRYPLSKILEYFQKNDHSRSPR